MLTARRHVPATVTLALGVILGWGLATLPRPQATLRASSGDRWGESILTTGPVLVRYSEGHKVQLAQDAIYYLDYKGGRLLATVPSFQQSLGATKLIEGFAERDLVADFKLDPDTGPRPHFMMTTGSLGPYTEGWAPLYVFESTTNQVASYKVQPQLVGKKTLPKFELLDVRSFAPGSIAQ